MVEAFTTSRIARRDAPAMAGSPPARSDRLLLLADTRTAAFPAMPFGDLRAAGVAEILAAAAGSWSDWRTRKGQRALGLSTLLYALSGHRGDTWQQRWEAAGLNEVFTPVARLAGNADEARLLRIATAALFALRVVRPSMGALRGNRLFQYADCFHAAQHDAGLDAFWTQVTATVDKPVTRQEIFADVALALTSQQIGWSDLTPGRLLAYAADSREYWRTYASEHTQTRLTGHQLWAHLCAHKHFPAGTPPTLREAIRVPRLTAAQLVDLYPIARREVAAVIAEYLQIRGTVMDYTSVQILAQRLASLFWGKIEQLAPDQADFALSPQLYDQWRETVRWQDSGKPREQQDAVLLAVRAFYYDINAWATQDPARWGRWAAACPVPQRDLRGGTQRRRRATERMAGRTRGQQPLLPALVAHVEHERAVWADLLRLGEQTSAGATFTAHGSNWQRVFTRLDEIRIRDHGHALVRLRDKAGTVVKVNAREERSFWQWAVVETLRLSGLRIEELLELTQLSIRQYQRPNGEVVALLVVAPSKTDRERVIPMSAELFHVIAQIISRHQRHSGGVPRIGRYDDKERQTSAPLPFLFQRTHPTTGPAVMAAASVQRLIKAACQNLAADHPGFADLDFTPHDFRRLFATDLVNSGLPIHIGAALLGHLNIQTTRGYVAVFDEEVIKHYQAHLLRRRAIRPQEEYRPVSGDEWSDFEQHFDRRKVELGSCARPYGTGCQHEHACIRCPVLQLDPHMLARLGEIETDLLDRRVRAEGEGWLGEIEGIDLTLAFLRRKRADTMKLTVAGPVNLGMPTQTRPSAISNDPIAPLR